MCLQVHDLLEMNTERSSDTVNSVLARGAVPGADLWPLDALQGPEVDAVKVPVLNSLLS